MALGWTWSNSVSQNSIATKAIINEIITVANTINSQHCGANNNTVKSSYNSGYDGDDGDKGNYGGNNGAACSTYNFA